MQRENIPVKPQWRPRKVLGFGHTKLTSNCGVTQQQKALIGARCSVAVVRCFACLCSSSSTKGGVEQNNERRVRATPNAGVHSPNQKSKCLYQTYCQWKGLPTGQCAGLATKCQHNSQFGCRATATAALILQRAQTAASRQACEGWKVGDLYSQPQAKAPPHLPMRKASTIFKEYSL